MFGKLKFERIEFGKIQFGKYILEKKTFEKYAFGRSRLKQVEVNRRPPISPPISLKNIIARLSLQLPLAE